MFNKFRNLSIKWKIIVSFSVVNVIFVLLIILTQYAASKSATKYEIAFKDFGSSATEAALAQNDFEKAIADLGKSVLLSGGAGEDEALKECSASIDSLNDILKGLKEKIVDEACMEKYNVLLKAVDSVNSEISAIMAKCGNGDAEGAEAAFTGDSFIGLQNDVRAAFDELNSEFDVAGKTEFQWLKKNGNLMSGVIIAVVFVILAILILFIRVVSMSLKIPAQNMCEGAKLLAEGDVNAEIKHFYDDELGELADALKAMQSNIKTQAEIAKEISEGNLDLEVTPNGAGDLLGNSIATMVSEENRVMSGIREAVMEIKTGSQEVALASQSLAQGSTEQASAIQEITASISDITERTRVNADDANEANTLVRRAKEDATEGNGKMHEMISAMADINQSSENISKIIKVIDDIAFQTNILALNAAVEAARAGAHGRGFAVVADEVRNLAGKSAQAASETAELIEDSILKVEKGSKLAEETQKALDAIVAAIDKIVDITNSIAVASNDQATAISQIDSAIGQVSQVVQTNSATSEQCAAASEELSAQAGKLREMISRYRLKDTIPSYSLNLNRKTEPIGLPDDDDDDDIRRDVPPVISLDDGFGKY